MQHNACRSFFCFNVDGDDDDNDDDGIVKNRINVKVDDSFRLIMLKLKNKKNN